MPQYAVAVAYQSFPGAQNLTLHGKGTLEVFADEPRYRFTGRPRSGKSESATSVFASTDIRNVTLRANSRKVTFVTGLGAPGGQGLPFVFYCASHAEALQVARLLPRHMDEVVSSWRDFHKNLAALTDQPLSPWTSTTNIIVALNVIVFVIMGLFGAGWFETASMDPYVNYVANNGGVTTDGQWWRLLTNIFVHYGAIHLALNMWALYNAGHFVERLFGRFSFALLYLGCGLSASVASIYWHKDQAWSAGASGAVFGVYGLLLGFILREKASIPAPILAPLRQSTLAFAGYNLVFGFAISQIDNSAHVGGLVAGVALGWLMALPIDRAARDRLKARRGLLTAAVFATGFSLGVAFLPRFPYSFREEQRWTQLVESNQEKADSLSATEKRLGAIFDQHKDNGELAQFLEHESIPFYVEYRRQISAETFDPAKSTAVHAKDFANRLDAYIADRTKWLENYQKALRQKPPTPAAAR